MISYKEWAEKKTGWSIDGNQYYVYRCWYLFKVIPLYMKRVGY